MASPGDQSEVEAEETGGESIVCDLCDRSVDTPLSKCIDCDVHMCILCTKGHSRVKQTRSHHILTDQDIAISLKSTSVHDQSICCVNHAEEDVGFYCYTCKQLICSICITSNHSNHKCSVIKHAAQEISKELSKSLTKLKENKMARLKFKIEEVEMKQIENNSNRETNEQLITERRDCFVNQINEICEKLLKEDKNYTEQNDQYLTNILENLKTKHFNMENTYTECNNILTTGSDAEIIKAWINSEPKLNKVLPPDNEVKIHLSKFVTGQTDISSIKSSFGSFDDENGSDFCSDLEGPIRTESVRTLQPEEKSSEPPQVTNLSKSTPLVELQTTRPLLPLPPVSKLKHPKPPEAKNNENRSFRIDGIIQSEFSNNFTKTSILNICPITDHYMWVHYAGHYENCIVNNNDYKIEKTVRLDFLMKDMAKIGNYIFATDFDNKVIYKMTTSGKKIQEINIALIHPLRLCGSSDGTLLVTMSEAWSYIINQDSRRYVARLTLSGREKDSYEYDNQGKRLFILPVSVAENVNGDICVLNRLSSSSTNVVILDNNGRLKVIYRGGPNRAEFDGRRLICDKFGHIMITDSIYSSVHLLNIKGELIQYLTTNSNEHDLLVCLAIDVYGRLWIGGDEGKFFIMKYIHNK